MSLHFPPMYEVIPLKSIDDARAILKDGPDTLNWLFTGTSGVHGTGTQPWDAEPDEDGTTRITVLIIQPRTVCARYGHLAVSQADLDWLTEMVRKTLAVLNDQFR